MDYDAIIIGAGMAGLTAGAYLSKAGYRVLICEKDAHPGGLVRSFTHNGFVFDGGIRAIENSGIVRPMLRQLGLDLDFVESPVSIGINNEFIHLSSAKSLTDYQNLLLRQFPDNAQDVRNILREIKKIMGYMDVLYGVDNPLFLDTKRDRDYLMKTVGPWFPKFLLTIKRIQKLKTPIYQYLSQFTGNRSLMDMVAQHFFQHTPASFALGYFSVYLDYRYPRGGTGALPKALEQSFLQHGGDMRCNTEITSVDPENQIVKDTEGHTFRYKKLICASDLKRFYNMMDEHSMRDAAMRSIVQTQKAFLSDKIGGDSVFSVFLCVDMDPEYFRERCSAHLFYTPQNKGLHTLPLDLIRVTKNKRSAFVQDREPILNWLQTFFELTTYEISLPVLRDPALAPKGKTGLIVSTLLDHSLVKHIQENGWYDDFKRAGTRFVLDVLDATAFPGLKNKVTASLCSTPLTIERITGNSHGAITGWAFTNKTMPAVQTLTKVAQSVKTPFPDILQAGQWTYSPSGLPISILTGKLAADRMIKQLRRER